MRVDELAIDADGRCLWDKEMTRASGWDRESDFHVVKDKFKTASPRHTTLSPLIVRQVSAGLEPDPTQGRRNGGAAGLHDLHSSSH
eukprot:3698989-Rhodomonas_salina.4